VTWTLFPPAARAEIRRRQDEMQAYIDGLLVGAGVDIVGTIVQIHESGLAWRVKPPAETTDGNVYVGMPNGKVYVGGNFTAAADETEAG
jgi:hypothetical protein